MVSDPPYGVDYDPSWRARRGVSSGKLAQGKVLNDHRADWREAYALFTGDVAYVWHGALHGDVVGGDLTACGFELRAQIIWAKPHFTLSRGHYHWRHETCWYAVREGKAGHWQGGRKQTTVWEISGRNPLAIDSASRAGDTPRKSRSSACAVRSSTTAGPVSWFMTRFLVRARA
jgi:hypothetical protein